MTQPLLTAAPGWREWAQAAVVYPLAALMVTALGAMGLDAVFPDFLGEDHAANRWRMGAIFASVIVLLVAATYRANRSRVYRLFEDRLEIGRGGEECVRFADVRRLRVGAPPPDWVQSVARLNAVIGSVKAANANAAAGLARQYARTVVFDLGADERLVINLATVDGGDALLERLEERLADQLESPPTYSDEERAAFGRFVPRRYRL